VTLSGKPGHAAAVVRDSRSGARLTSVPVPFAYGTGGWPLIAAGNDLTFALALPEGSAGEHFFLLHIAPTGRSGRLTALPIRPVTRKDSLVTGLALSPDGQKLAMTLETGSVRRIRGVLVVASTRTGATRTWTGRSQRGAPVDPSWAGHARQLGFVWYNRIGTGQYPSTRAEARLLDTTARGHDLLASRVIVPEARVPGAIRSALLTPDGRKVIASVYRATSSGPGQGTVVVRIVTFSAATGRIIATHRSLAIPYHSGQGKYLAEAACRVLSLDSAGQHALAQCKRLGRLAGHSFTVLPGTAVSAVATAAW
jgi:hypothetical protein